jgi:hypothetical protein
MGTDTEAKALPDHESDAKKAQPPSCEEDSILSPIASKPVTELSAMLR